MTSQNMAHRLREQSSWCVNVGLFCTATDARQDAVLAPFRALVSKSALRLYLNTLLFMGAAALLIGVSAIAYGVFYFKFIPTVGLQREVHLQFG